jgi:hypothetical protein
MIIDILKEMTTPNGYSLCNRLLIKFKDTLSRPTSSSGIFHNRDDGSVPTILSHVTTILDACYKTMISYDVKPKSSDADLLALAILLHDIYKYGRRNELFNSTYTHDELVASKVWESREMFIEILSDYQIKILTDIVQFHMGRWASYFKYKGNNELDFWKMGFHPFVYYVHLLDMLSSRNCLKEESIPS